MYKDNSIAKNKLMLDIKSKLVLKILIKECPNGAYNIVDGRDIISMLPNKYKLDTEGLDNILIYLERQEFISIKYDDDGIYCLCVLPFGNEVLEHEAEQKKENSKSSLSWVKFLIIFIISFIASFLGTLCAYILFF